MTHESPAILLARTGTSAAFLLPFWLFYCPALLSVDIIGSPLLLEDLVANTAVKTLLVFDSTLNPQRYFGLFTAGNRPSLTIDSHHALIMITSSSQ